MLQHVAQVVSIAIAVVGVALFVRAIRQIVAIVGIGQPLRRSDDPGTRTVTMLKESLGHTRMLQWTWVGAGHWFVFIGFGLLFFTLVTAFGQLFDAHFAIPWLGHFFVFEWASEVVTLVMIVAIAAFIGYRLSRPTERERGPKGRFFGSRMWQGYFVELVILGVGLCIAVLRGLEYAIAQYGDHPDDASFFHFPVFGVLGEAFSGLSEDTLANLIYLVAMIKIIISFVWMITISMIPSMGVAWHRFLAFFNIWFRREADGSTALGAMKPMTSAGEVVSFDDLEDLDEDTALGVGKVEDFAWKGILDFTTCTECGRCQSQCPAWNTEKPLSPKMLVLSLRDHAHAKAPYLLADSDDQRAALPELVRTEAERPLVGSTEGFAWGPDPVPGSAVIDDDVLWSCTSCGACVQQCPVDIEHVDHIMDMRRYQVLVESSFPSELNGLFKGLENKGNPWNMNPNARMEWAQGLDFPVRVVGEDVEDLADVDWLFWVGCAGAYEDRAKKTTRAVAELLNMAGVDFAVLGNGETCTGDPARRAGNEFVFQGLATQNAETFKEMKAKKVVATCAHCFNTLKNEYAQFGVELEVVHHTQLLNRLVREKKLTPVATPGGERRTLTYHDPCYLGRHNQVYAPPRELLEIIPDADVKEMPRNSERSFCCGAGGARMWMEEKIGERINVNRTKEAVATGADQIAVGCPFCRVMLSDGLTAQQSAGEAREEVEVLDVAQLLLASVKGEAPTKAKVSAGAAAKAGAAASGAATASVATKDEPEAGDATQTEDTVTATEDAGPLAKASGGTSLFDVGSDDAAAAEPPAAEPPAAKPTEKPTEKPGSGGSLFDIAAPQPTAKEAPAAEEPTDEEPAERATEEPPKPETKTAEPADSLGSGSLFDIAAPEPAAKTAPATEQPADEEPAQSSAQQTETAPEEPIEQPTGSGTTPAKPVSEIGSGSLFDIATPEPAAKEAPAPDREPEPEPADRSQPTDEGTPEPPTKTLHDIKAAAEESGAEPAPVEPVEPDPGPEPGSDAASEPGSDAGSEAEPEEQAKPSPSTSHQPKTDTDIQGAGSLFDL